MNFIDKEIELYASEHSSGETEILRQLVGQTEKNLEHSDMLSGPLVGRFLNMLVHISGSKRILEVGTFTGYSAIWMADALPAGGKLITLEMNELYQTISHPFFKRSPYNEKIEQIMGPALETIQNLEGPFDFVFIDADKLEYRSYYEELLPRLQPGGLMVIDNALWSGGALQPEDEKGEAIRDLNRQIATDIRVENLLLPLRDGLMVVRKVPARSTDASGSICSL